MLWRLLYLCLPSHPMKLRFVSRGRLASLFRSIHLLSGGRRAIACRVFMRHLLRTTGCHSAGRFCDLVVHVIRCLELIALTTTHLVPTHRLRPHPIQFYWGPIWTRLRLVWGLSGIPCAWRSWTSGPHRSTPTSLFGLPLRANRAPGHVRARPWSQNRHCSNWRVGGRPACNRKDTWQDQWGVCFT